jgi:uncharacterized protein YdaU (DUF1376 family)|nr:DUF1376 domain-containing protein [Rhodospirillales bacterium]
MHYYKFNIADYRKDTVHLSPIEHYIYRQLIDTYYLDEKPISLDTKTILRKLRLSTNHAEELDNVLADFFTKKKGGYCAKRIDLEIAEYHEMADKNKANGRKGGRPKKTQSVSDGLPKEPTGNLNYKPLTINYKQKKKIGFIKPTVDELNIYALENDLNITGFYDYYESNGWMVGRNKMKNYKAACNGWSKRQEGFKNEKDNRVKSTASKAIENLRNF